VEKVASDLLLIGSDNPTTWIVYNRLVREFGQFDCIIEEPVSRKALLRNRARKLGWRSTIGQVVFVTFVRPLLNRMSRKRVRDICRSHDLEAHPPYSAAIENIENINSPEGIARIKARSAKIVIVNGTRILKPAVLNCGPELFINTHQGITPQYRGAHGAYWAVVRGDMKNCGVTVHAVDEGIDTGEIIDQAQISPTAEDNFASYPYLQTSEALPILINAVKQARGNGLQRRPYHGPSAVWYHPTAWQYLMGFMRGVR
jgi:folate-dependent phosphoribosylglycinamide formyltransferase PurN